MSEVKTWRERKAVSNNQWPTDVCMQDEIDELRAKLTASEQVKSMAHDYWIQARQQIIELQEMLADYEAYRPVAVGLPDTVKQFQLAIDAAFAAGKVVGQYQHRRIAV